mmetsp:Transcript_57282/g.65617  ORF Transcript_57282/g.65617 Transcript_57282/m.65617 type:complete len:338 (-) Transcript_57282:2212-3225(-)
MELSVSLSLFALEDKSVFRVLECFLHMSTDNSGKRSVHSGSERAEERFEIAEDEVGIHIDDITWLDSDIAIRSSISCLCELLLRFSWLFIAGQEFREHWTADMRNDEALADMLQDLSSLDVSQSKWGQDTVKDDIRVFRQTESVCQEVRDKSADVEVVNDHISAEFTDNVIKSWDILRIESEKHEEGCQIVDSQFNDVTLEGRVLEDLQEVSNCVFEILAEQLVVLLTSVENVVPEDTIESKVAWEAWNSDICCWGELAGCEVMLVQHKRHLFSQVPDNGVKSNAGESDLVEIAWSFEWNEFEIDSFKLLLELDLIEFVLISSLQEQELVVLEACKA